MRSLEHYARRHLGDDASAQDAVQTTIEALLRAKSEFRGESTYSTYAFAILRHKISDALRERKRFPQLDLGDEDGAETEADGTWPGHDIASNGFTSPERQAHAQRLGLAIQVGLQYLSPRSRQVFLLRERMGWTSAEISDLLGLSLGNTWVLLCRSKRQLRESLIAQGYGVDRTGACDA